ncbi:MAG: hypothetical protein NTX87_09555 [Planctomycetota bacterium]|nr:hypothetical protein [Planctomycetota bacterium]
MLSEAEVFMLREMGLRVRGRGSVINLESITQFALACLSEPSTHNVIAALRQCTFISEVPYENFAGLDKNFPAFDEAFWFRFHCDYRSAGCLEFLLRGGRLLQTGYILTFVKRLLSDPSKKAYEKALRLLVSRHGEGEAMPYPGGAGRLFNDSVSHCYIARTTLAPNNAVVLRVGDRAMWDAFTGNKWGEIV